MPRAVQSIPDQVTLDNQTADVVSLDGLAALEGSETGKVIDLTKYDDSGIIPGASAKARIWQAVVGAFNAGLVDGTADSTALSSVITSEDDLVGGTITVEASNPLRSGLPGYREDDTGPQITALAVPSGSAYVDITFDDGVYAAEGGAIDDADLELVLVTASGVTAASISSVKQDDSATEGSASALAGGETTVRAFLSLTGAPDGSEEISVSPAPSAIMDEAGNLAPDLNSRTTNLVA